MIKLKNPLITLFIFIILNILGIRLVLLIESKQVNEKKIIASDLLASEALTIKNQIDRALSSTYGIAFLIQENNGKINNFQETAKTIKEMFKGIDSINIAPDIIVKEVYPVEDKEQLIGINLLDIEERKSDILKAIKDKKLTLGGPYKLIEGGMGFMGRMPVFIKTADGGRKLWGLVNVTINFENFINSTGLNNLKGSDYAFELYRFDDNNSFKKNIIFSSEDYILKDPVTLKINLPNNIWYLSLNPKNGWIPMNFIVVYYTFVIILSFVISIFIFFALIQPDILRKKIIIATNELADKHKKLEQAEKLANFGKLTSAIAHEIRQPLNSIKILTDGVLFWDEENHKVSYDELKEYFINISKAVDKIDEIIKNLRLMINSPEKIKVTSFNINKIIMDVIKTYKQKIISHSIKFNFSPDNNIKELLFCERQFQQIVINLIDNSINALDKIEKNDKLITIITKESDDFLTMIIIDNGIGIEDDKKETIFEPFYTTNKEKESMGMGLYVIRNILNTFQSQIKVFNNELGGATFEIKLFKTLNDNLLKR